VRKSLTFHPVETLEEVLAIALRSHDARAVDELLSTSAGR
jgi:hypothetical protein